jgi:polyhydroxyalkanoic acid synthase PhaR subunit
MAERGDASSSGDLLELWKQWYAASARAYSGILESSKDTPIDSRALSQLWLKGMQAALEQMQVGPAGMFDAGTGATWKRWLETTSESWRRVIEQGGDPLGLALQWTQMLETIRANIQAGESIQADLFALFKQWYDATSETWAQRVEDVLGSEQFIGAVSRLLEDYTGFVKTTRRAGEAFLNQLQLPTRADIARVAGLVVTLEEKVDQIQDEIENASLSAEMNEAQVSLDERLARVEDTWKTAAPVFQRLAALEKLEGRLDLIENKLDSILAMLERAEPGQQQPPAGATSAGKTRRQPRKVGVGTSEAKKVASRKKKNANPRAE